MVLHFLFSRIKGLLDKGAEVVRSVLSFYFCYVHAILLQELELLSVRESVELLSAVAQLDTNEVSPCLIEIVRPTKYLMLTSLMCVHCRLNYVAACRCHIVLFLCTTRSNHFCALALLEHNRKFNPDLWRCWMGRRDTKVV